MRIIPKMAILIILIMAIILIIRLIITMIKKTLILISPKYNEMELLNSLTKSLKNQGDAFSMSWNFYSYINSNNTNLTNNE